MPDEGVCSSQGLKLPTLRRLVRAWVRDPESFDECVRQSEDVTDLCAGIGDRCLLCHAAEKGEATSNDHQRKSKHSTG